MTIIETCEITNVDVKYHPCDMTTLARLIRKGDLEAGMAWSKRYGHSFPIYAVINKEELQFKE